MSLCLLRATRPMNPKEKHKQNANLEHRSSMMDRVAGASDGGGLATLHRVAPGSPRVRTCRIKSLAALTKRWMLRARAGSPVHDDETWQALEALGYLDPTGAMQGNRSTVTPATATGRVPRHGLDHVQMLGRPEPIRLLGEEALAYVADETMAPSSRWVSATLTRQPSWSAHV